jgi:predicted nucleic acid-binding protein
VVSWLGAAEETLLYLSVLTLGEIRKDVATLTQGQRGTILESWLEIELQGRFAGRLLSIDEAVADRWCVLAAEAKAKRSRFIDHRWIAASDRASPQFHDCFT